MKVVQINATCGRGSTGKICVAISKLLTACGVDNYILHSGEKSEYSLGISCSNNKYIKLQAIKARVFGNWGLNSKAATRKIISELERIKPDIVHLHNIHGHDCDFQSLFNYFKKKNIRLVWTFHDCWAFTGYCTHFIMSECDQWKNRCEVCPQKRKYSWLFDRSAEIYTIKKKLFFDADLTISTPSKWLAGLVKQSFLQDHPVKVIHNGIDLSLFTPMENHFISDSGIWDKYVLLGVAFGWGNSKGLDVFIELSKRLNEKYQIVLIGTNDSVDKQLPSNIISIHRTSNQAELVKIYSSADLFVNPTREDSFPTVNMEALACGTPVVTFCTGGSPEVIDETCGSVVNVDDVDAMEAEIIRICETKPYSNEACVKKAKSFDMNDRFLEYIELYREIYDGTSK